MLVERGACGWGLGCRRAGLRVNNNLEEFVVNKENSWIYCNLFYTVEALLLKSFVKPLQKVEVHRSHELSGDLVFTSKSQKLADR